MILDFAEERNYIFEHIYPSLKSYFLKNHNHDFQVTFIFAISSLTSCGILIYNQPSLIRTRLDALILFIV